MILHLLPRVGCRERGKVEGSLSVESLGCEGAEGEGGGVREDCEIEVHDFGVQDTGRGGGIDVVKVAEADGELVLGAGEVDGTFPVGGVFEKPLGGIVGG